MRASTASPSLLQSKDTVVNGSRKCVNLTGGSESRKELEAISFSMSSLLGFVKGTCKCTMKHAMLARV